MDMNAFERKRPKVKLEYGASVGVALFLVPRTFILSCNGSMDSDHMQQRHPTTPSTP